MLEYYPMRVHTELPDGYREAAMTYASDEWMARLVLGFGPDVRVLAPDSLVERVRGGHRRAGGVRRTGRLSGDVGLPGTRLG